MRVKPRPFGREQGDRPAEEQGRVAELPGEPAPYGDEAHREPADIAGIVVAEHRAPRGGERGPEQQRPTPPGEQGARRDGDHGRHGRHGRAGTHRRGRDRDERGEHRYRRPAGPARREVGGLGAPGAADHALDSKAAAWRSANRGLLLVPRLGQRSGHSAARRAAIVVATTAIAATTISEPVPCPMPSHGSRTASVSWVSGSGPAMFLTMWPITWGGGPPAPSRNEGEKISSPTAWAD